MTRIKICGITCLRDAMEAVAAGADALGFVFAPSPRRIDPRAAGAIVAALPPFVCTVGVTVDASAHEIEAILELARVDLLQFHGNESARECRLQSRPVLKRIPVRPGDNAPALLARTAEYAGLRLLIDPGSGDGRSFPHALAQALPAPFVLAGGLGPDNVGEAIRLARPSGIDVSSGVETTPGRKDPRLLRALVHAVRLEDARHAA